MKKIYYFKKDLRNVTEYYYGIILSSLKKAGYETVELENFDRRKRPAIEKDSYILATDLLDFFVLYLYGYRKFVYWFQGISPEEHYLIKKSKWKYWLLSYCERLALKKVKYRIGVSKYLFEHYNVKYHMNINLLDVFIMPCYNTELQELNFFTPDKYQNKIFCYAGGVQKWQGFEEIVAIYQQIEMKHDDVFLKIYSKQLDEAKEIISKYSLKHYSVDCVPQDEVDKTLADCMFGFIIRNDSVINNVATPTKLATYVGNGVIPIYTGTIHAYKDLSDKYQYLCCIKDEYDIEPIEDLLNKKVDGTILLKEYEKLFNDYFNTENYIKDLSRFFQNERR